MNDFNSLEDQFKDRFTDFEVPVPDKVKAEIDVQLFGSKPIFWSKFRIITLSAILGMASIFSFLIYISSTSSHQKPANSSSNNQINFNSTASSANNKQEHKSKTKRKSFNSRILKVSVKSELNLKVEEVRNSTNTKKENKNNPSEKRKISPTETFEMTNNPKTTNEIFSSAFPRIDEQFNTSENNSSSTKLTTIENVKNLNEETKNEENTHVSSINVLEQKSDTLIKNESEMDSSVQTTNLPEETKKKLAKQDKSAFPFWSIEANSSAVFNLNKTSSPYSYSLSNPFNFGLLGSYSLTQKLTFGTGLQFQQQNEQLSFTFQTVDSLFLGTSIEYVLGDSNEIIDSIVVLNFSYDTTDVGWLQENRVQHFSIPLFVETGFPFGKNWRIGLQTGVRFNFFSAKTLSSNGDIPLPNTNSFGFDFLLRPKLGYQFKNIEIGGHVYTVLSIKSPEIWTNNSVIRNSFGTGVYVTFRF